MRPQPLIAVTDVEASSRWYQKLLGCKSDHGGEVYERLNSKEGNLILQLHCFKEEHHHGAIADVNDKPYGNGVLLWFEIDDIDRDFDVIPGPRSTAAASGDPDLSEGEDDG